MELESTRGSKSALRKLALLVFLGVASSCAQLKPAHLATSPKGQDFAARFPVPRWDYAEEILNQQVMPYRTAGRGPRIEHLVHPTIGNPRIVNLEKLKANSLEVIFRSKALTADQLSLKKLVKIFLMPRKYRRYLGVEKPLHLISETQNFEPLEIDAVQVIPDQFSKTFVFQISKEALLNKKEDLYDLRLEWIEKKSESNLDSSTYFQVEYQYNAVQIFESAPSSPEVHFIVASGFSEQNFVEGQYSSESKQETKESLRDFVEFINFGRDESKTQGSKQVDGVRSAAFVVIPGFLTRGPNALPQDHFSNMRTYAYHYAKQYEKIEQILKELTLPVVLLPGASDAEVKLNWNFEHDQVKDNSQDSLDEIVRIAKPVPWSDFSMTEIKKLAREGSNDGNFGGHLFYGAKELESQEEAKHYFVKNQDRKFVLFDGLNYWRKTFGSPHYTFEWEGLRLLLVSTVDKPLVHRDMKSPMVDFRPSSRKWVSQLSANSETKPIFLISDFSDNSTASMLSYFGWSSEKGVTPFMLGYFVGVDTKSRDIASESSIHRLSVPQNEFWVVEADTKGIRNIQKHTYSELRNTESPLERFELQDDTESP